MARHLPTFARMEKAGTVPAVTFRGDQPVDGSGVVLLIPVFNDWIASTMLLGRLDEELHRAGRVAHVLLVDDGSVCPALQPLIDFTPRALTRIDVLRLRRNLGHQRAIAIGLTYIECRVPCGAVVVMDGDGEDDPADVPRLLTEMELEDGRCIVFAARHKRSEGLVFRTFYALYRAFHRVLTGIPVNVGNFSAIPRARLHQLVVVSDLWTHYAASVVRARLPRRMVPTTRAKRLAGHTTMNFVSLVTHGLSGLAVHAEVVGVRTLVVTGMAFLGGLGALGVVLSLRLFTSLAIPGWATSTGGLLLVLMSQLVVLAVLVTTVALGSRSSATIIPLRDYAFFVDSVYTEFVRRTRVPIPEIPVPIQRARENFAPDAAPSTIDHRTDDADLPSPLPVDHATPFPPVLPQ